MLARTLSLMKLKKNCIGSMIFYMEKMTFAFIGPCRDNDFIGLKWLEILLRWRCLYVILKTSQHNGIFMSSGNWRLETTLFRFLVALIITI